ncbi:hypothetical protein [Cupriavidus pauculus]|uniref:hypothetical protein n=1 Tax=Cupriavidus pauculus TaxID=82633 RepID=UPI00078616BC|nr:hypothetical protein [Cupriavidus pauculus]
MNSEKSDQQINVDVYKEVGDTVVAYLVDCGRKDTDVTISEFLFALDHAYKPLPRFWRDFQLQPVISAVLKQYPSWLFVSLRRDKNAQNVLREVKKYLKRSAFDEANAEMLMALPPLARPTTAEDALEWICMQYLNEGRKSKLKYANWIGLNCGEEALEVVHGLEKAAAGVEYTSGAAQFARQIRDQCIRERRATLATA